jgi:mRNA interferase MazF
MVTYIPKRGDIIWLSFDPQAGHEQAGTRPALVLSPYAYNAKLGLALVCPITSKEKGYSFEIPIPDGLPLNGVVLSDHIKSIDWRARKAKFICEALNDLTEEVLETIQTLL